MPTSPVTVILLVLVMAALLIGVHLEVLALAFHKLGLSREQAGTILLASIAGSFVNLPLFRMHGVAPDEVEYPPALREHPELIPPYDGVTMVSVNVGGCVIPVALSIYLLGHADIALVRIVLAIATVTAACFLLARPVPAVGMGMPVFAAPAAAVLAGIVFGGEERALLAYVAGTTGVLLGADILRIGDIRRIGAAQASIGGAGTFDGIFFTGIIAVLIA